jgi:hypothetical protein
MNKLQIFIALITKPEEKPTEVLIALNPAQIVLVEGTGKPSEYYLYLDDGKCFKVIEQQGFEHLVNKINNAREFRPNTLT